MNIEVENQLCNLEQGLVALDILITNNKEILYRGNNFKDYEVVGEFVSDHRPLKTALLGADIILYKDSCFCCIPSYDLKDKRLDVLTPEAAISYLQAAVESNEAPDLIFANEAIYRGIYTEISELSPQTKLIVACDEKAATSATQLRNQGIPAIDNQDYIKCAPLNAVIALTVFDELMVSK